MLAWFSKSAWANSARSAVSSTALLALGVTAMLLGKKFSGKATIEGIDFKIEEGNGNGAN